MKVGKWLQGLEHGCTSDKRATTMGGDLGMFHSNDQVSKPDSYTNCFKNWNGLASSTSSTRNQASIQSGKT